MILTERICRMQPEFTTAAHILRDDSQKILNIIRDREELLTRIKSSPNLHKMKYTYLHRQAIFKLANELNIDIDYMWAHDTDKYIMYLFEPEDVTRQCHRTLSVHHWYEIGKRHSRETLIEMMLDWESARFSKPDKPLNAYDTLYKWMPEEMREPMLPILEEYGLNYHQDFEPLPLEEYQKLTDTVTPDMILYEMCLAVLHYLFQYIMTERSPMDSYRVYYKDEYNQEKTSDYIDVSMALVKEQFYIEHPNCQVDNIEELYILRSEPDEGIK